MQNPDPKHIDHKKEEQKDLKRHIKHETAKALEEEQWHKHPGGG